ncbi:MAG: 3' terminal RNA ribose 2'-O-methyltransferase Hen1 [Bacteroidia bacterium]|nr:3' terminal RNA ribose 2'-O-methyltransferase Hen1 [Bacteroidia bacterium]
MLLTITTTHQPATDLGYLLHKHPDKFQTTDLSVGRAHVFYPEVTNTRLTVCLLLDIDPIEMVRGGKHVGSDGFSLGQYVNDRPYVASSFMSAAISKLFSSALNGNCKDKPELVDHPFPFEVSISAIAAPKGGEMLIRSFFEPLGYEVELDRKQLDSKFPDWGESNYFGLLLKNTITTKDLLNHLYVLIPALDSNKHYFISEQEIEKLFQKGEGWLKTHPQREIIARRYLFNLHSLSNQAILRLKESPEVGFAGDEIDPTVEVDSRKTSLHEKRIQIVAQKLKDSGASTVLDVGCGEGKLIRQLLKEQQFSKIAGMDVSYGELLKAKERMHWDEMAPSQKERIDLFQGSLTYLDRRLNGFDAAAVVEVIEHLDLNRLKGFERVLFEFAKPKIVIVTTPNKEFNVVFEGMNVDAMRHDDHRFEWTRAEFEIWATNVAITHGYRVEFFPIGDLVDQIGAPSQMAIFNHGN